MRGYIRLAVIAAAAVLAHPALAQAQPACEPVSGAEAIWQRENLKWVVVGEIHGSVEMPAAFAQLVCLTASNSARPIVIGIELPPDEQPRLDAYMASDGGAAARAALLAGPFWHPRMLDGRSSAAWLGLIEQLRQYKAQGRIEQVFAVRRTADTPDQAANEAAFADAMREIVTGDRLALIYVGNLHAAIRRPNGLSYDPAAAQLPREAVLSINMMGNGGSYWNCLRASPDGPVDCGPHDEPVREGMPPRQIQLVDDARFAWSALFSLGGPTTASPPAVPAQREGTTAAR